MLKPEPTILLILAFIYLAVSLWTYTFIGKVKA